MSYEFFFEPGDGGAPPLVLLHGTGGDETQLVGLARSAAPGAPLLALRGKVNENGKLRFFKRFADGFLDEDDMRRKAAEAADFLKAFLSERHLGAPIAVGYSNGANLAAAIMFLGLMPLRAAVLMRAVAPFAKRPQVDLQGRRVLILSGSRDTDINSGETRRLADELSGAGAAARHVVLDADHELCPADIREISSFLNPTGVGSGDGT